MKILFQLRDLTVKARVSTDLVLHGTYKVSGNIMGGIKLDSAGGFRIKIKDLSASGIVRFDSEKNPSEKSFIIEGLKAAINYNSIEFEFDNLLGKGVLEPVGNMIVNTIGEIIVDNKRREVVEMAVKGYKEILKYAFYE